MSSNQVTNDIRRLRFDNARMTQQQLADKAGVTRQTIIAIESGRYTPSLPLAFKIAQIFNQKIEQIFHYNKNQLFTPPNEMSF